ncbi:transporter, partial [Enterobacter cloacae subsp. cloacae]
VLILIGYSVIAIPTGLITTHMSSAFQSRKQQRKCPGCHRTEHELNARYCNRCGSALPD